MADEVASSEVRLASSVQVSESSGVVSGLSAFDWAVTVLCVLTTIAVLVGMPLALYLTGP
jgi:phage shock protein PspC (stress-responsive transcriptional regulator)